MLINNGEGQMMHGMVDGVNISVDCMGSDFADVDADSDLDLIVGDSQRLILLEQIENSYIDVSLSKGLTPYANIDMAWAVLGADFDNDGSMELLSSNSEFWTPIAGATHTLFDFTLNELGQYEY